MDDVGTRAGGLVMVDLRSDRSTDLLAPRLGMCLIGLGLSVGPPQPSSDTTRAWRRKE